MSAEKIRTRIRDDAQAQGFDQVAFVPAEAGPEQAQRLSEFIEAGYMGQMTWLDETRERRASPQAMWPEVRTAIVLSMNYAPDHDPMQNLERRDAGNISVYARGRDYHDVLKGKLKQIASRIAAKEGVEVKVFVDTAPLMEKPLAARGGLGWQGKHTNLVSRDFGSWLFLGVILTDADWGEAADQTDHCGSCTACLDICPTKAFPAPYKLDARRCISYLTIEHAGPIPHEFRRPMGNRIFGCDDCLAVCPWNRFAREARESKLKAKGGMPDLGDLLGLDEAGFRKRFAGTPVRRAGYEGFMRNVLIATGNSENAKYVAQIKPYLHSKNDVIKGAAIWALGQLLPADDFAQLRHTALKAEDSPSLRDEWQAVS
jgi:epoxyqueuosine reductase